MALSELLVILGPQGVGQAAILFATVITLIHIVRNEFFHPLSHVPGPFLARSTSLWLWFHVWNGDEASVIQKLHQVHGPVVRVGPNEVDIGDGAALQPIYAEKGGFLKDPCYANFYIQGQPTIFSALDPEHRKPRAKAVISMFATGNVYANSNHIFESADVLVSRLRREGESGRPFNVLNVARCFALDSFSSYLFGERYGALYEESETLSASAFVDFFVAFGRFFYLPAGLFGWVIWVCEILFLQDFEKASLERIDAYAHKIVEKAAEQIERQEVKHDTYQGRLLHAGFSKHEAELQCQDLIFAGQTAVHRRLQAELAEAVKSGPLEDDAARVQSLPYLRAVVQEGLRISSANPTRLPRIVPPGGWEWLGYKLPAGTSVGVGAYQLHRDEKTFKDPAAFIPDRWLDADSTMQRDNVAFGVGARQCIAKTLATAELLVAVARIAASGVLEGLDAVGERIEIVEWFNSRVPSGRIELMRTPDRYQEGE